MDSTTVLNHKIIWTREKLESMTNGNKEVFHGVCLQAPSLKKAHEMKVKEIFTNYVCVPYCSKQLIQCINNCYTITFMKDFVDLFEKKNVTLPSTSYYEIKDKKFNFMHRVHFIEMKDLVDSLVYFPNLTEQN